MNSSRDVSVVAVAGVDPSGGAGLVRDALTGAAVSAHVIAVGTAWTIQPGISGPGSLAGGGYRVEARDPAALGAALEDALRQPGGVRSNQRPLAVKVGMVPNAAAAAAILAALERVGFVGPVVVDPVLAASSGAELWAGDLRQLFPLLRRATVVTPNAVEASLLAGRPVQSRADATLAGRRLLDEGLAAVLLKGGHLAVEEVVVTDLLFQPGGVEEFSRRRLPGPSPRGTGCALSTAIAAQLAAGAPLRQAVAAATDWLAGQFARTTVIAGQRHLP